MEKIINTFSERLSEAMQERDISQYRLAALTGIPQSTISRYLGGKREISICYLVPICKALEVSSDYLLGLSDY